MILALVAAGVASADQVTMLPTEDSSIYEDSTDTNAGGWKGIVSGRTNGGSPRRALIRFGDLSAIPSGAIITNVELKLRLEIAGSRGPAETTLSLHRLTEAWVEGDGLDELGTTGGGGGGEVVAGAVTWDSREHDTVAWTTAGGTFVSEASASTVVTGEVGNDFSWTSTAMEADVQAWLDGTTENDGWILVEGTESGTGRGFLSSEANPESEGPNPRLIVDYATESTPEHWILH